MVRVICFFSFIIMGCLGCQKRVESFIPDGVQGGPDTVWQAALTPDMPVVSLKTDLQLTPAVDSFPYDNTGIIYNNNSLALTVPANGLVTSAGLLPSGYILRRSLLVQKRGDFISEGISTVSSGRLLVCGGSFFMTLTGNGERLVNPPGSALSIKYNSDNNHLPGLKVFNAVPDLLNGFNWQQNNDTVLNKVLLTPAGYEVLTNSLPWVLPGYELDTTGIVETSLTVKLPYNYTNTNTEVYISFDGMLTVAALRGDAASKTFISGPLPINQTISIVVISKQAGDYYFATEQTATAPGSVQPQVVIPVKSTLADIKTALSTL